MIFGSRELAVHSRRCIHQKWKWHNVRRLAILKSVHLYCKKSSYDFPSAGILHNSVDFVTPSTWLGADSADVCRLNVKHSKISVLMKPATTLIGTLLKIQFEFFLNIWCTKYLELNHMLCSTAMMQPFIVKNKNENNTCLSPLCYQYNVK